MMSAEAIRQLNQKCQEIRDQLRVVAEAELREKIHDLEERFGLAINCVAVDHVPVETIGESGRRLILTGVRVDFDVTG